MFSPDSIERVDFEVGERARAAALASYSQRKADGAVVVQCFPDVVRMRLAAATEISRRIYGDVFVFIQDSERKGVYRSSTKAVSRYLADLLKYDGSTVFVSDTIGTAGVLVDYEAGEKKKPYEIEAWG